MISHLARVDFRNDNRLFGIKSEDRFSHIHIIGKTGTGKSTLLETMAIQDLESGNGFALIDPHGDLVERIAQRIPASRRSDVIYLDAANPGQPYGYNPLRHVSEHRIALAASGMLEVFKKMWPDRASDVNKTCVECARVKRMSSPSSKRPGTRFANSRKIRAIPLASERRGRVANGEKCTMVAHRGPYSETASVVERRARATAERQAPENALCLRY